MTVWNFSCPSDGGSYNLPVGPSRGFDPAWHRNPAYASMGSASEPGVVHMRPIEPVTGGVQGTLLTQAQHNTMLTWWQKTYPVVVTDRQGRTWTVLITELAMQRVLKPAHPWFHTWTMQCDITGIGTP